ncbi:hypothetical protein K7W42_19720 [Deinococcus sp. HMF7604]|uniref:hypothetical protein n=1 Tax=Deinococcus betulae TaxID=2873312 RepID=UPI001CCA8A48|nr:hypothetical protein [Deinococcus betulae]MBZ9753070.1 hypothetical protein [Deinococcus betulae]
MSTKDPATEAEFTRKMVLGILGTLEQKGLLSKEEVDGIIRAARQQAQPRSPRPLGGPASPGTVWVQPGQAHEPLDRSTPVAIPNVQRTAEPVRAEAPPMIDLDLG